MKNIFRTSRQVSPRSGAPAFRRLHHRLAGFLLAGVAIVTQGGCGSMERGADMRWAERDVEVELDVRRELAMFNGHTAEAMSWDELVRIASEADVVLIGEQHGHQVGLTTAAALWEDTIEARADAALSMEFFERDEQIALDDYLTGITDKETFLNAANRSPGNYPPGHRAMVEAAKDAGRTVIAANAPRRYIRKISEGGFEAIQTLRPAQRSLVVLPESVRERFFEVMSEVHGEEEDAEADREPTPEEAEAAAREEAEARERIEAFFKSQLTWDATMTDSILRAVDRGYQPVVHVVGQFHTDFGGGIPNRLRESDSTLFVWTVSVVSEWSEELREEDEGRADCVIYVGPREGM